MGVVRCFMGWDRPAIEGVVAYLSRERPRTHTPAHLQPPQWDLSDIVVAVPTSRFGRRLLERLAETAQAPASPCALIPPAVVTLGALEEHLWPSPIRRATATEETLAWIAAMRTVGRSAMEDVLPVPQDDAPLGWFALADLLSRAHTGLAREGRTMQDAAEAVRRIGAGRDRARWTVLSHVEDAFGAVMERAGLTPRSTVWRRRDAGAASCGEDGSERTIVIASCPTIPAALEMRLRSSRHAVTALVHAPPSESAAFSEMGRPTTSAWADRRIALSDDDIVTADTARDQAAVVVDRIGTLATDFGPDEISVCLGDPAMEAILRRMLRAAGTPTHHAFRRVLALTRPVRLLSAIADHMESRSMDAFAALVRHPDLDPPGAGHATVPTTWRLHDLDCLRVRRLSDRVPSAFANVAVPTDESGGKRQERGVSDVAAAIARLVAPLGTTKRPIVEWAEPIARVLVSIYDPIMSDERSQPSELTDSLQSVGQWLRDVSDTDPNLGRVALLTGPQALRFLVRSVSDVSIPEPVRDSAVEVLDWFETPYDDAPVKIVTTMNEGHIPARPPDDPLIPDALRAELGLPDAEALHALDAFHLAALAASTRHLCLISGRISADGDTLKPSRLLFACDDAALPARASRLFAGAATERHMVPFAYATASRFALPRPRPPSEPIAKLSVTAFRDYLACPYRFYLRHVLGLETITDAAPEMDAPTFGSLIHEALGAFARGPSAHETLETAVCEAMEEALDQVATAKFGRRPPPAVALQVTQARRRLRAFAAWQAERAAAGWVIRADWVELDAEAAIVVDDAPFTVHGRIDRIEHHPQTGRYALFDYKTGDTPRSPQQSHRSTTPTGFDWVDLQLPLYRRIAPLPAGAGLDMGYLWLGPDASADALLEADWSDADLALADVCADEVIRRVRNGVFWPPSSDPRTTDDGIGAICMDACADRRTLVANPPSPWDTA